MANKDPLFTDITNAGRVDKFADPQHFTGPDNSGRARTGEKNPFPSMLYGVNSDGEPTPVNVDKDGNVLTQLTGSNVEYDFIDNDYEDGVVKTRTMGLSWETFSLFSEGSFEIPANSYIDRSEDVYSVNGFGTIGIIIRDIVNRGRSDFRFQVYWQGVSGRFITSRAVNESFEYIASEAIDTGLTLSIPTKSEYVSFRLFNLNEEEDRTFYARGMLRAS